MSDEVEPQYLEDDQIKELLKKAESAEGKAPVKGATASTTRLADGTTRAGFEPNVAGKAGEKPGFVDPGSAVVTGDFDLTPIRKRDAREKAEHLTGRLWEAAKQDPVQLKLLLQRVQADMWRQGKTVAFDDLRALADELIKEAELKEKEKR